MNDEAGYADSSIPIMRSCIPRNCNFSLKTVVIASQVSINPSLSRLY